MNEWQSVDRTESERSRDQADGLRQRLLHPNARKNQSLERGYSDSTRPRIVLLQETPPSDCGIRFAFHLARSLHQNCQSTWMVDLTPCASRIPNVLGDCLSHHCSMALWTELLTGNAAPETVKSGKQLLLASATDPSPQIDQLPRLYEQLLRRMRHPQDAPDWCVLITAASPFPIDRACWLAAEEIVMITGATEASRTLAEASCRLRVSAEDAERRISKHEKHDSRWSLLAKQLWADAVQGRGFLRNWPNVCSPTLPWPHDPSNWQSRHARHIDRYLERLSKSVADQMSKRKQTAEGGQVESDQADIAFRKKNIQLPPSLAPINEISDKLRA